MDKYLTFNNMDKTWKRYEELSEWELMELRHGLLGYRKVIKENGKWITYFKVDDE